MPDAELAPEVDRLLILECLRDQNRRLLDQSGSSRNYLDLWEITELGFYSELIKDLEKYELFIKPLQNPSELQRYQFVMRWDEDEEGLLIHITLSPRGEPPKVKIACHPHNTGYLPLPLLLTTTKPKNEIDNQDSKNTT